MPANDVTGLFSSRMSKGKTKVRDSVVIKTNSPPFTMHYLIIFRASNKLPNKNVDYVMLNGWFKLARPLLCTV